jgi:dTDP-4-dehydrorhamnose reductase
MAKEGKELKLFHDVYFSPLSIQTLCDVICTCLNKKLPGVYNVGAKSGMSKELFLKKFLKLAGLAELKYASVSVDDMNFKTPRPKDMRMNVSLFEQTFNYKLPKLINEIESVANEF